MVSTKHREEVLFTVKVAGILSSKGLTSNQARLQSKLLRPRHLWRSWRGAGMHRAHPRLWMGHVIGRALSRNLPCLHHDRPASPV